MSWHCGLVSKSKQFELSLNVTIQAHSDLIMANWSVQIVFLLFILSRLSRLFLGNFSFEHWLILWAYRHQLLSVKVCFSLLINRDFVLISIIQLGVSLLKCHSSLVHWVVLFCLFGEFLECRECLLFCSGINLHSKVQIFSQIKVTFILCSRHDFFLLELLANFHGDARWENGSFDLINSIN